LNKLPQCPSPIAIQNLLCPEEKAPLDLPRTLEKRHQRNASFATTVHIATTATRKLHAETPSGEVYPATICFTSVASLVIKTAQFVPSVATTKENNQRRQVISKLAEIRVASRLHTR
jgi:hypothetical protein